MQISIKEKVINQSIKRIEKRSKKLNELIYANPVGGILDIRIKAQGLMEKHKGDYKKLGELMKPLALEEKRLKKLHEAQMRNGTKWAEELGKIDFEQGQLRNELYYMKQRAI